MALIPSTDCVVRLYCVRFVFMVSRTRGAAHVTLTKAHVILFFFGEAFNLRRLGITAVAGVSFGAFMGIIVPSFRPSGE